MLKPLSFCCLFLCFGAFALSGQNMIHQEMLGRPTDSSITVQAFFDANVEARIQYGTSSGVYAQATPWQSFTANAPTEITVDGLQPNTAYFYRLCYRAPGNPQVTNRPEFTFHTQRPANASFTFVVQADPHMDDQSDTALYRLCLKNQGQDQPDFMIDLGDFLMTDKLKNAANVIPHDTIPYRCHLLRKHYETISPSVPLFIALGNHEGEAGWNLNGTANNIAVWNTEERKKYFLNPAPGPFYSGDTTVHPFVGQRENYYAWTWGDALFVVLDPYWYTSPKPDSLHGWRWTLGKTQYDWLRTTLENSSSTFKFVFAHQIIGGDPDGRGGVEFADRYEWGGKNLDGTPGFATERPGWYKPIKDLLTENRVTIFFHGHDHFFGKQEKDCLIYQETPQPSHPNFTSVSYAADYGYVSGQILPNSGHLRVHVGPAGVQVEYVRAYLPQNENALRHNKDVSASYAIGPVNCYDSMLTGVPVLWNADYADELVYPNPFKEKTIIHFSLSEEDNIQLTILDEAGAPVRKLLPGQSVKPGRYDVVWDGKSNDGGLLPDGNYFYSLRGRKGKKASGKITLMK